MRWEDGYDGTIDGRGEGCLVNVGRQKFGPLLSDIFGFLLQSPWRLARRWKLCCLLLVLPRRYSYCWLGTLGYSSTRSKARVSDRKRFRLEEEIIFMRMHLTVEKSNQGASDRQRIEQRDIDYFE